MSPPGSQPLINTATTTTASTTHGAGGGVDRAEVLARVDLEALLDSLCGTLANGIGGGARTQLTPTSTRR